MDFGSIGAYVSNVIHLQAIGSVFLLVGFLVATGILQQRIVRQTSEVLESTSDEIKKTKLHAAAVRYFSRRQVNNLFTSRAHVIPIYLLLFVVSFCSLVTYFGAELFSAPAASTTGSYVLGGALASRVNVAAADLLQYQSGTVFVGSMAFLGAYLWTIAQLINRINNDDMSPVTYFQLSIRILTACIFAGIARHIVEALPLSKMMYADGVPVGLAVLGFIIGWNPTLWIGQLLEWISTWIKRTIPAQRWPQQDNMPLNMTLASIQGLVDDKIERIRELDIDNCQKLAAENPILIWVRTPYTLVLIADWIAQAQLCIHFEDDKVSLLRSVGIRDVFALVDSAANPAGQTSLATLLNVPEVFIADAAKAIAKTPAYRHLAELREAL